MAKQLFVQNRAGLCGILRNLLFQRVQPGKAFFRPQHAMQRYGEGLAIQVALKIKQIDFQPALLPVINRRAAAYIATPGRVCPPGRRTVTA